MTEIDGKKYYTWQEVLTRPLGTKFRRKSDDRLIDEDFYLYFERDNKWEDIELWVNFENELSTLKDRPNILCYAELMLQDRFEIVEDEPEREYVTGIQALEKLINGEWKKIACDDEYWKLYYTFIEMLKYENGKQIFYSYKGITTDAISATFLKLKCWYEYKD